MTSERVKKRRAVDEEPKFNAVLDEGASFSKQPCQPTTSEDEIQSRIESHSQCSVESLQSIDYYDSEMEIHDVDAKRLVTVQKFTFDPVLSRKELAKMIILHDYPVSVVEQIGFRDFLRKVNPSFGVHSQNTVENDIMKIFKFERCTTFCDLGDNSSGGVAITTKMWTSNDGNQRFLAITGHIIDDEWKRQSYILRFANLPLPCTNESISKVILDCFSYFDVIKKLSTITVDSYTSDDKLVDILVEKLSGNKLLFREKLFQLPCFAHTLSLMVQDGLDVVRHVIEKICNSIVFWTSSPEREMTFKKAACELGVEKPSNEGLSLLELRQNPAEFMFKRYLREMKKKEPEHYEVDLYLKEYFDPETKDFKILSWWNKKKTRYPVLHKIAKEVLAIPIFSVDVENAFDIGDKILGANRSRLRPTMVEALMCTQSWIRRRKNLDS